MGARSDDPQVSPYGQRGLSAPDFAAPAVQNDGSAVLARAVDHDLATPYHAPATERAYAHDWADFIAFCDRHQLEALPAEPQTLALYLKALETRRSASPAGIRAGIAGVGTKGLALPTLRRRLAARCAPVLRRRQRMLVEARRR